MNTHTTPERMAYNRQDAATLLGVSVTTIERLLSSGELSCKRVGRRVLIPRVALESFLKEDDEPSAA